MFVKKCKTFVGSNGRALTGDALHDAESALQQAKMANHKIWADNNGVCYYKERKFAASAQPLLDKNGNQVLICGRMVSTKAKFCSKCGASAPGSWWRCAGCGNMIGNESMTCPHCGRVQNPAMRLNISDGKWCKNEDIFAERFELQDVEPLIRNGLNIQENHYAIMLDGGAVTEVLPAGFYAIDEMNKEGDVSDKSMVMVDRAEFVLPVCVEDIHTADEITSNLHAVVVLRFDPANAGEFMCNLMGNSLYLTDETLNTSLGYDAVAHCILADTDAAAREYCNNCNVADLFKDANVRIGLENHIAERLKRNLTAIGMTFVRLKEVDFASEVFDQLREKAGQLEIKRREIEFIQRANELANDATRREAMSEYEMEEFMNQLAHEKGIKDDLRQQELERLRIQWSRQQEKDALNHEHDMDDLQQMRQLDRDRTDAAFKHEMLDLDQRKELERRIAEQKASLEYMQLESNIENIKIDLEKKKADLEFEVAQKYLDEKLRKQEFLHKQKLETLKAAEGASIQAMLMAEDDEAKRRHLLELHEQQMQSKMTPELLLAAAAARGNAAAAEALSRLNSDQLEFLERAKNENREIYEQMLQMNERMFNQATERLSQKSDSPAPVSTTTTQIIK